MLLNIIVSPQEASKDNFLVFASRWFLFSFRFVESYKDRGVCTHREFAITPVKQGVIGGTCKKMGFHSQ